MNNFEEVIGRLTLAHARVKSIDPKTLSEKRLKERSTQLRTLRRATDALVGAKFSALAADAQAGAAELGVATEKMMAALNGIQKAIDVLDTISSALGTITSLVRLIKPGP